MMMMMMMIMTIMTQNKMKVNYGDNHDSGGDDKDR